tara:strand:- start:1496 stop:2293 length:798 start_codon:yes stop_codon:yes gene_type:complete
MTASQEQMMAAMQKGMAPKAPSPEIKGDESAEAKEGRATDTVLAHLTAGEVVVPVEFLQNNRDKLILSRLFEKFDTNIDEYTVGNEANKVNPETGNPEFFFRKLVSKITDDVLGFDPGGGGIFDVPVIGDAFTYLGAGSPFSGFMPSFMTGPAQTKVAREYLQKDIEESEKRMKARLDEYSANIDAKVKQAKEEGKKQVEEMKNVSVRSKKDFESVVKGRIKAEMGQSLAGEGAAAGGGVEKSAAKFSKRKRRVKRAVTKSSRPR